MCYKRGDVFAPLVPPTSKVRRTWMCWTTTHAVIADEFVSAWLLPAGEQFVPCFIVHAAFQATYGDAWEVYWRAWKANWGFSSVPDDGSGSFDCFYPANLAWVFEWQFFSVAYWTAPVQPPGCSCAPGGYAGNE